MTQYNRKLSAYIDKIDQFTLAIKELLLRFSPILWYRQADTFVVVFLLSLFIRNIEGTSLWLSFVPLLLPIWWIMSLICVRIEPMALHDRMQDMVYLTAMTAIVYTPFGSKFEPIVLPFVILSSPFFALHLMWLQTVVCEAEDSNDKDVNTIMGVFFYLLILSFALPIGLSILFEHSIKSVTFTGVLFVVLLAVLKMIGKNEQTQSTVWYDKQSFGFNLFFIVANLLMWLSFVEFIISIVDLLAGNDFNPYLIYFRVIFWLIAYWHGYKMLKERVAILMKSRLMHK